MENRKQAAKKRCSSLQNKIYKDDCTKCLRLTDFKVKNSKTTFSSCINFKKMANKEDKWTETRTKKKQRDGDNVVPEEDFGLWKDNDFSGQISHKPKPYQKRSRRTANKRAGSRRTVSQRPVSRRTVSRRTVSRRTVNKRTVNKRTGSRRQVVRQHSHRKSKRLLI